jgi:hypothetical protein
MAEQLGEPLEPRIPEAFVGTKPVVGALERTRIDTAVVDASAHSAFHQAGPLQGLDVLRCCGKGHVVRCRELANGQLPFGEPPEHGTASVIAERPEDEVESRLNLFNHVVEYMSRLPIVNRFIEYYSRRPEPSVSGTRHRWFFRFGNALRPLSVSDLPEFMMQQRHHHQGLEAARPTNALTKQALFSEPLALVQSACARVVCLDVEPQPVGS